MRIAITGGAGFIGHHLAGELVAKGHSVVVIDNLRRGSFERAETTHAEAVCGDIRDFSVCERAFVGADCVVHLAAQANVMGSQDDPEYTVSTNVAGTWAVARAAAECSVPHLVFASSREVYGEPTTLPVSESSPLSARNLYGASKIAGEALLSSLPWALPAVSILRLANVIGSGDSGRVLPLWLDAASRRQPLRLFGGDQVLDFVPMKTVVEAFTTVVERGAVDGPINVGSGTATTLRELALRVLKLTGSTSQLEVLPPRGPEVTRYVADIRRMRECLGIEPPADPLASVAEWWATS